MKRVLLCLVVLLTLAGLTGASAQEPALRKTFRPKEGGVTAISFRPDGKQIAIGSASGRLKVKDLSDDGEAGGTILNNAAGWCQYGPIVYNTHSTGSKVGFGSLVCLSPGGTFSVFYTDDYENQTAAPIGELDGRFAPFGTLSTNGRYLALTKGGQDLWIGRPAEWHNYAWDYQDTDWRSTLMRRPAGVQGRVVSLSLNHDGSLLAAAYHTEANKGAFVLFNRKTGKPHKVKHVDFPPTAVAFSPKGTVLSAVGKGLVWIGDPKAESGKILPAPPSPVTCVAFSPNEKLLAAACADGTCYVVDTVKRKVSLKWKAHEGAVTSLAWQPDSKAVASGGTDGAVRVWDLPGAK